GRDEADAVALVLEVAERLPAPVLALVGGRREGRAGRRRRTRHRRRGRRGERRRGRRRGRRAERRRRRARRGGGRGARRRRRRRLLELVRPTVASRPLRTSDAALVSRQRAEGQGHAVGRRVDGDAAGQQGVGRRGPRRVERQRAEAQGGRGDRRGA